MSQNPTGTNATSYSIGKLAQATGVPTKTIRYYEEVELLPAPKRTSSGYRSYTERDAHVLRFIKRSRDFGFSVRETAELLALWNDEKRQSREVKRVAGTHLKQIERKLLELEELKATLEELILSCRGNDRPDCPILERLAAREPKVC